MIKDGGVVIVDEFTGRLMPGRRWSEGLHQAVEAKEGVKIQNESRTLATVTFQNYFRMLIADEPTGNLDPVTSWEIIQLLIQINELGTTVLMATHNQEIVNAMRRRVLALEHGTLVRDESGAAYEREY